MTRPGNSVLSAEVYHISARISNKWLWEIYKGRKTVEFRVNSEFWSHRCKKAQKMIKNKVPVILILICGPSVIRVEVEGIGLAIVRGRFWDERHMDPGDPDASYHEVWTLLLGDVVETKGVAYARSP